MDDRSSKPGPHRGNESPNRGKGHKDLNETAFDIVQKATGERPILTPEGQKNPAAVTLGRLGGLKGGKARAQKLTPEQRAEIAKRAAEKRWRPTE
ncbi:MAG: hypothetical protein SFV54_14355 [Bryobacteraceae bacterium]|nr:hypothetical protein [Bryobacteraceae bacterium]